MADSKMTDTNSQDFDTTTTYFGRVKWFNNKAGYGFCTVVGEEGDERVDEDIFVHHSGVKVGAEQYKYLVQGEYVQFKLRGSDSSSHPYQAADLVGPWDGKLMCETRNEQRQQRAEREGDEEPNTRHTRQRGTDRENTRGNRGRRQSNGRTVRLQGAGPREGETWTLVKEDKRKSNQNRSNDE
jgi:cold shock CspA family protein